MIRILIVSPIPSHPQDQGNSARIFALGRLLQRRGALVHFLYYPLEGLRPAQREAMERDWDALHIVPVDRANIAPGDDGQHALDGWYDPRVGDAAAYLQGRYRFAAVITNYVWFSAVLDRVGTATLRILDTHDVFGGRDERFRQAGLAPEWFWTTPAREAQGLSRADIVLAIQDEEAELFRGLGHSRVRVLGHLRARRARTPRSIGGQRTIGYLASANPINLNSFLALQSALRARGGLPTAHLVLAGALCDRVGPAEAHPFAWRGRVDRVEDFYDAVDLVVNPMTFGTGLKIKSVEALFEGVPLVATRAAMTGLPARHPLHCLDDAECLAACLPGLLADPGAWAGLAEASLLCAQAYADTVALAMEALWGAICEAPYN